MSVFLERQEVRERRAWGTVFKRIERISLSVMIVLAGVAALYGLYRLVFLGSYFQVNDIVLRGHWERLDATRLVERAGARQGDNLFLLDVDAVHDRLMADSWVREAAVRRYLPNTLLIAIEEYVPKAVLIKPDGMYYVDSDGVVFKMLDVGDERDFPIITGLERYEDLVGPSAEDEQERIKRALDIFDAFRASAMGKKLDVAEIHFDPVRGFSVITGRPSLEVLLGMKEIEMQIERVNRFDKAIRTRGRLIRYILADEPGRVIVKYRDGAGVGV